ncbi:extensin family protein [Xanthobacter sp. AM11]|uniref:extensin family protein n=1 Tax=Xanthobacter sp. AM11 TaxID=3380643 RepID=UPI0039BFA109
MHSRRPAPPRHRSIACPAAIDGMSLRGRLAIASVAVLLAGGTALAETSAPLPPQRPLARTMRAPRAALPAVPLPPARPAELDAAQPAAAEAVAPEEAEPEADDPRVDAPARLASRSVRQEPEPEPEPPGAALPPTRTEPTLPAGGAGAGAPPAGAPAGLPAPCAALVAERIIVAAAEPGITTGTSCGLKQPVRLSAVWLRDGRLVEMRPAAILKCDVAAAVADWVREDLAPAVAASGAPLDAVKVAASYDCRPRNRMAGARMSEHGLGNAVDVGGFELGDRRTLAVEKGGLPPALRASMKESACRRFTTVLGPGSDGYHEDHIHVDLAQRKRDFRLCRWNLDAGAAVAAKTDASGRKTGTAAAAPAGKASGTPAPERPATGGTGAGTGEAGSKAAGSRAPGTPPPPAGTPGQKPATAGGKSGSVQ